jgi:hypothetical protein
MVQISRPSAFWPRSAIHVEAAFAINRFCLSVMVHDVADRVAPPHDRSFRFELCLPDWAKEIDFQFHRSEGFLRSETACKRYFPYGQESQTH